METVERLWNLVWDGEEDSIDNVNSETNIDLNENNNNQRAQARDIYLT